MKLLTSIGSSTVYACHKKYARLESSCPPSYFKVALVPPIALGSPVALVHDPSLSDVMSILSPYPVRRRYLHAA